PHLVGRLQGPHLKPDGVRIKVGVITRTDRLGMGWDHIPKGEQVGEIAGVAVAAEAAARAARQRRQQPQAQLISHPPHRPRLPRRAFRALLAIWQQALGIERERKIYKQSTEVYKRNWRKGWASAARRQNKVKTVNYGRRSKRIFPSPVTSNMLDSLKSS